MPVRKTTFGPVAIVLRGAGSLGHDPQAIGSGKDVGLDIQIPVSQAANAFQISRPDGTVVYAISPGGAPGGTPAVVSAVNFAVPTQSATYAITSAAAANWSIQKPVAGKDDGITIRFIAQTVPASGNHLIVGAVPCFYDGSAPAACQTLSLFNNPYARTVIMAYNGFWLVERPATSIY